MKISSKFKSIQSSIFCAVSILVLSAVLVVTVVSLRYTNSSIYENSVMYTQTIIKQLNQNIDSYISKIPLSQPAQHLIPGSTPHRK